MESRPIASACTCAGATTKRRTISTSRSRRFCRCSITPTSARSSWKPPTRVIDTETNYVEHHEVVADRLERAANAIGDPRRVMAGTDCGFETSAGLGEVAEEIVWAKLRAMRAGADLASHRLFH